MNCAYQSPPWSRTRAAAPERAPVSSGATTKKKMKGARETRRWVVGISLLLPGERESSPGGGTVSRDTDTGSYIRLERQGEKKKGYGSTRSPRMILGSG